MSDSAGCFGGGRRVLALLGTGQGPDLERTRAQGPAALQGTQLQGQKARLADSPGPGPQLWASGLHSLAPYRRRCVRSEVELKARHLGCGGCKCARPHSAIPAWALHGEPEHFVHAGRAGGSAGLSPRAALLSGCGPGAQTLVRNPPGRCWLGLAFILRRACRFPS